MSHEDALVLFHYLRCIMWTLIWLAVVVAGKGFSVVVRNK